VFIFLYNYLGPAQTKKPKAEQKPRSKTVLLWLMHVVFLVRSLLLPTVQHFLRLCCLPGSLCDLTQAVARVTIPVHFDVMQVGGIGASCTPDKSTLTTCHECSGSGHKACTACNHTGIENNWLWKPSKDSGWGPRTNGPGGWST
jgi:hypothetical protein